MRRGLALLLALALLACSACAQAEVFINEEPPSDWAERQLFRLTAIDVDRSDAMLLECGGEAMMVDGGSGQFRDRLFKAVDEAGVTHFKYLFSTHSDNDHIHGLTYMMNSQRYQIDMFTSPNKESYRDDAGYHVGAVRACRKQGIPYHQVEDGEVLTLGGATLQVMRCTKSWGSNARSAVLMVRFGESSVLLTGDIDARTMRYYVQKYGADALKADILKAPHHGIATIVEEFRQAVRPAVIFVPNLQEKARKFSTYMKTNAPDIRLLYSGDATIVMETDGMDWYIWQTLPEDGE